MNKIKGDYVSMPGQKVLAIIEQGSEPPEVLAAMALSANWNGYKLDHKKGIIRDPEHPVCDVTGCDERYRCLNVDCPKRCALYRMEHRSEQ